MAKHDEQTKTRALAAYAADGLASAHHQTGVPKGTISRWAGQQDPPLEPGRTTAKTQKATKAKMADVAERKALLASDLLTDIDRLRRQLFEPCVEVKALVLSGGLQGRAEVEIVELDRLQPTFQEQQRIITAVAIGVDKVQLLTGEATARLETRIAPERTPEQEAELAKVLTLVPPAEAAA